MQLNDSNILQVPRATAVQSYAGLIAPIADEQIWLDEAMWADVLLEVLGRRLITDHPLELQKGVQPALINHGLNTRLLESCGDLVVAAFRHDDQLDSHAIIARLAGEVGKNPEFSRLIEQANDDLQEAMARLPTLRPEAYLLLLLVMFVEFACVNGQVSWQRDTGLYRRSPDALPTTRPGLRAA